MGAPGRRHRGHRHHRPRPERAGRRGLRRPAGGRPRGRRGRGLRRGRERQGGLRRLCPDRRQSGRGECRPRREPGADQQRADRGGLVLPDRAEGPRRLRRAAGRDGLCRAGGERGVSILEQLTALEDQGEFARRHIGPGPDDITAMLKVVGAASLEEMSGRTVPAAIRGADLSALPPPATEAEAIAELRALSERNARVKSLIGLGYHGTHTPPVILRNVLENPGWYTAYTPYQAEIAQGRLEALVNFQTMVSELAGLDVANASLLDEATAAAEAVALAHAAHKAKSDTLLVAADLHPQTLALVRVPAERVGIRVVVAPPAGIVAACAAAKPFALLLNYPGTTGEVRDLAPEIAAVQAAGGLAIICADPLALTLLTPPGEMGADVVVGSTQRFGVPLGYGGPHAAVIATKDAHKRTLPRRPGGGSVDAAGRKADRPGPPTRGPHNPRRRGPAH